MTRRRIRIISVAFCLALIASVLSAQTRPSWHQIKDTPTTVSGYGITDALKRDLSNAAVSVDPTGASTFLSSLNLKFSDLQGTPTNASYTLLGLSERDFFSLTGRPTTYAGYGLTEGVRLNLSNFVNSSLDPTGLQELKNAVGAELPENITANIVSATTINATMTANVKDLNADKIVVASQSAYDIDAARITTNNLSTTGTLGSVTFSIPFHMRHNADFFNSAAFKGPVEVRNSLLVASQTNFNDRVYFDDYARFEEIPDFVKGLANLNASGTTRMDSAKVLYSTELNTAYLNGIATFTKAAEFLAGATFWGTPNFKGDIWCDYTVGANRLTADNLDAPFASHTQRLSALRLNFLSSLTNLDIPGSYITAHPVTGAVQHFFNNSAALTLGAAGVTVSDLIVSGTTSALDFGAIGEINSGVWDVGDGVSTVNLAVNKGNLVVVGNASATSLNTPQATVNSAVIASATISRLEVANLVYDFPSTGTATALLASTTTTTLPFAFQHPSYPSSRDSDSGVYSPAGYKLGFRAGQAPGTPPWLLMQFDRGIIATGVYSIYKAGSDAEDGLTISGGTLTGGGSIYLAPNSSPYVSISNASQAMMTTYGDIVRFGSVEWDDTYYFSVGGRSRIVGRLDVSDGVNVAKSSAPVSPANGTIYYDTTTHKFKGYANGAWVDLH